MRRLLAILSSLLGFVLFMGAVWVGCGAFLKNNDAYERGLETALADPELQKALGGPIEEGWFINGSVEGDGVRSHGVWLVRLRGTEDSGTLRIAGIKASGDWRVVALTVETEDDTYDYVPQQGFRRTKPGAPGAGPRDITGG
ncbi:MAG: cytochrome c oxidase assembly factor Coa1 family protein [Bacteroidota bacterium]